MGGLEAIKLVPNSLLVEQVDPTPARLLRGIPRRIDVEAEDVVAVPGMELDEVGSNEPGAAGDKESHGSDLKWDATAHDRVQRGLEGFAMAVLVSPQGGVQSDS